MKKQSDFILLAMLTLMYGTVCMETDMYVPAFPIMKDFFGITDHQIQAVLSYNFFGILLGSLLFGPLSDSFGRYRVLKSGLALFTVSSWGCVFLTNFDLFLSCRFIQGMGAAAPMVTSFAMLLDKYEAQKVSQLCSALNLFIAGAMAGAPILGSILILYFSWQANFFIIAVLSSIAFIGSFFFLDETLDRSSWLPFSPKTIFKDFGRMLTSTPFMLGSLICYFLFAGFMVFIANLSLIFIEHLNVSQKSYGFYQASIMGTFALVSTLGAWMIGKFGTKTTKYVGLTFSFMGTIFLCIVSFYNPLPILICGAMSLFTMGATLASVIYGVEAVNVFPNLRGISSGLTTALRHLVIGLVIAFSSTIFDGSMRPIASLTAALFVIVLCFAAILKSRENLKA
ncbi:MAG: MFS transporter [Proteobacteria bacterium]|nr:MFS transporter [Pseudomonadota bacterium]